MNCLLDNVIMFHLRNDYEMKRLPSPDIRHLMIHKMSKEKKKILKTETTQIIDMIKYELLCNNGWAKYAKYFTKDIGHSSKKILKYNNNFIKE